MSSQQRPRKAAPAKTTQPAQRTQKAQPKSAQPSANKQQPQQQIPERDIRQNAGVSASMSLQAAKKAWELRQAAHGAADAKFREQLLAKAINKEIEAESFGKAAKYTQSGAFQGLAAGAGLGVKPGVTLGKLTGALVGGTVATVTGLLGGGIGSVYGAMNGPMWDLGEMASHGVHNMASDLLGDWMPDFAATSSQKKALEKMVMQTKNTQAPTTEELEQIKAAAPDAMPESWSDSTRQMNSYIPSMPSMPSKSSMPSMPSMAGMTAALGFGGKGPNTPSKNQSQARPLPSQAFAEAQARKQNGPTPKAESLPTKVSDENPATEANNAVKADSSDVTADTSAPKKASSAARSPQPKAKPTRSTPSRQTRSQAKPTQKSDSPQTKPQHQNISKRPDKQEASQERKKPRKLATRDEQLGANSKKTPRKLERRQVAA